MFRIELSTKELEREDILSPLDDVVSGFGLSRMNAFTAAGDNAVVMYHGGRTMVLVSFFPVADAPYARIQLRGGDRDVRKALEQLVSSSFANRILAAGELEDEEDE